MPDDPAPDGSQLDLARGVVRAWEHRDLDWLVANSTPDVELRPFMWTDLPFRGADGITAFVTEYLAVRTPLRIEVERVRRAADPVALDVHVRGHLHMSNADLDEHPTFVFWVRDGKLARYEGHIDPDAIEEATARPDPGGG
ncbi:MAG TPA: nuclear transport factor 2 family protein [Solirubrobacteraceae bacterium]|nr:nuclear transport factor 2 family protein [Solirubrobacteraceae bacterium]